MVVRSLLDSRLSHNMKIEEEKMSPDQTCINERKADLEKCQGKIDACMRNPANESNSKKRPRDIMEICIGHKVDRGTLTCPL